MKTKKLTWRLGKLPTVQDIQYLVENKFITKEEAKAMLFNEVDNDKKSVDALKSEIKFLRDLVDKLSNNNSRTIEIIREIEIPYRKWDWHQPYSVWCGNKTDDNVMLLAKNDNGLPTNEQNMNVNFNSIKTF